MRKLERKNYLLKKEFTISIRVEKIENQKSRQREFPNSSNCKQNEAIDHMV